MGQERDEASVLRRTEEIFNRVRSDAFCILGVEPDPETLPLPRFMTRRPLI